MRKHAITFVLALCLPFALSAQQSGNTADRSKMMIGNVSQAEFERINGEASAKLFALKATNAPLSDADKDLFRQIVKGGTMQAGLSKTAVEKVTRPETRELAQAEVEEQTNLAAKLQEIAIAKGLQLPTLNDTESQPLLSKMKNLSGNEIDAFYISESGIKGHEKLEKVMSMVQTQAKDSNLKDLAGIALPLIRTHLQISKAMQGSAKTTDAKPKGSGQ